ncbi:hypothetical protein D3C84_535560 [compost metagenome]
MLGGEKRPESHAALFFVHASAGIAHHHADVSGIRRLQNDGERAALVHGLQRVGQQTVEYLRQLHLLAQDHGRVLRLEHHLNAGLGDLLLEGHEAVVHRRHQVHRFRFIGERAQGLQQFPDPRRHAIDLTDDVVDVLVRRAIVELQRQFGTGANGRQRVTQTVGHRR